MSYEEFLRQLAGEGLTATEAYKRLRAAGLTRRRQDFLRDFAAATGRAQRGALEGAKRAATYKGGRFGEPDLEELARAAAGRFTPQKFIPPAESILERPFTFAEGARYQYRFRYTGVDRYGRRVSGWVSGLWDDLVPIEEAADFLSDRLAWDEYTLAGVPRLVFDSVVQSTK